MDPVTAICNTITAGFEFFSTPVGQKIMEDWLKLSIEARISFVKAFRAEK